MMSAGEISMGTQVNLDSTLDEFYDMYCYNQNDGGGNSSGLGEFWNIEPAKKPTCGAEEAVP